MKKVLGLAVSLAALSLAPLGAPAARADETAERTMVNASRGPVANQVDLSLRNEVGIGLYHKERTSNTTWLEPSFPTSLGADWILAHDIHLPLVWQPVVVARTGGTYGLGALRYEMYLAPAAPGSLAWGLGYGLQFPTDSDYTIGDHKWAAGPSGALSWWRGPLYAGLVATQLWTYASSGGYPTVNRLSLRPTVTYELPRGFYLVTSPAVVADWKRPAADRWTVPLGGGVGRVFSLGGARMTLSAEAYWTAVGPTEAWSTQHPYTAPPDWTVRAGIALLLPR